MKKIEKAPIPVYYRLQRTIQEDIETGRWKPGECIPSEKALAEQHHVSIGTVKKALLNLAHEGYLYRLQGKGTFVAGTTLQRESLRYYRLLKQFGGTEASLTVRLLNINTIRCFKPVTRYLGMTGNQKLFEIKRLFLSDETPVVYHISYLPVKMFQALDELPKSLFEKITMYKALEKHYGLPTIYNHELFTTIRADVEISKRLKIPKASPILFIEMLSFTYKDRPYEYRKSYIATTERKIFREI
ncbi:MAG: GntR family transcriptional regulator [Deltaproteobacteria bacterium]|nr:GntR family transcriptional regulator [Deltaproteobacteria bacterium]MBW2152086.1 GntR family transcriptional regulator [Deltaproteobacteria bacterium]